MWSLVWAVKFPHIALCWAWIQLQLVKAQIQNSAQFQRLHCLNWKYLFLLELFPVSPHYLYFLYLLTIYMVLCKLIVH